MMPGSLSIGKKSTPWNRAEVDAYLVAVSVGLLAGLAVTYLRTPLQMPGHKVLFWMAPALACRLATRAPAAATVSTAGTIASTLILGGQLAGGAIMMPLVLIAGITLDLAVRIVEHQKLRLLSALPLLAMAGLAGNLVCFMKRLVDPAAPMLHSAGLHDLLSAGGSYALFGLIAALLGAMIGFGLQTLPRQRN